MSSFLRPLNKTDSPTLLVSDHWSWRVQAFIPGFVSLFPPGVTRGESCGHRCCLSSGRRRVLFLCFLPLGSTVLSHLLPCEEAVHGLTLRILCSEQPFRWLILTCPHRACRNHCGDLPSTAVAIRHILSSIAPLHFSWHSSKASCGS